MGYEDYVSDLEASSMTGVSIATLHRFAEVGYLHIEADTDGLKLFSESELLRVFGARTVVQNENPPYEKPAEEPLRATEEAVPPITFVEPPPRIEAATAFDEPTKLTQIVRLQEKLLDLRENEINDLKEQRSWLKSRIEKLEEQSDRDRVLLLSEAQTIKQLIALDEPKKSPLRAALEYFGFASANQGSSINPSSGSTYEVSRIETRQQ